MGAIYGIFDKKSQGIPSRWAIGMRELLSHRIVDGEGDYADSQIFLGKCNMAISPESYYDNGPLEYGELVICGDIDIYNRDEFIEKLETTDTGQTDSQLVALAYQKWQNDFTEYIVGDFALVIWDKTNKSLTCFVDHIGVRQFHYYDSPEYFVFSTEIRTLKAVEFIPFELYDKKLEDYLLTFNYNKTTNADTYFEGIKKLPAARFLFCKGTKTEVKIYWDPKPGKKYYHLNQEETAKQLHDLIHTAVHQRMHTNHKIGVTLSGGLDSSTVACIAARKLKEENKKLYSVSSVLPDNYVGKATDEREYIQAVLDQEDNIEAEYETAEGVGIFENFENAVNKSFEIPNFFYYMDYEINKKFRKKNVKVILTGYVGDSTVSFSGSLITFYLLKKLDFIRLQRIINEMAQNYSLSVYRIWVNGVFKKIFGQIFKETIKELINRKIFRLHFTSISDFSYSFKKRMRIKFAYFKELKRENYFYNNLWNIDDNWFYTEVENSTSLTLLQNRYPLSDKRIIDFIYHIEPISFVPNGWRRGLIRIAMKNKLPTIIGLRKNKKDYSPDFSDRFASAKINLNELFQKRNSLDFINIEIKKIPIQLYSESALKKNMHDFPVILSKAIFFQNFVKFFK